MFRGFGDTVAEVALALAPLAALFVASQLWLLRRRRAGVIRAVRGIALSFLGLAVFLQGVNVGILPAGEQIGRALASSRLPWLLVPVGFVLGLVATLAEPAVRILNHEVDRASGGYIRQQLMLAAVAVGVAFSVALGMLRVLLGFSLWWVLLPGYALALGMAHGVRSEFAGIAFDAGGVATGPMTVTFILAVSIGAAAVIPDRDPLHEGFGMIGLVALAPIISVLALGLMYASAERRADRRTGGDKPCS